MNLATTCRTCLQQNLDEPVSISTSIWEFLELELRMQRIPRVHPLLELPQNVCVDCYRSLITFKRFYAQCHDADDFWKMKLDNVLTKVHDKVQENAATIEHEPIDVVVFEPIRNETNTTCVKEEIELLMETNNISMNDEVADDGGDGNNEEQQQQDLEQPEVTSEENDGFEAICDTDIHFNSEFEANENIELEDDTIIMVELNEGEFTDEYRNEQSAENMPPLSYGEEDIDDDEDIKEAAQRRKSNQKRFQCQHCERRFANRYDLHAHENIHAGIKPFHCDVCGKSFRQKNVLRTHQTLHFGKKIQCQECGKKFARKSQLIIHDRMHRNERPFQCDYDKCSAAFRERQHLLAHQKIHSGMREHQCEYCANAFYHRKGLLAHLRDVHGPDHYKCDLCARAFNKPYKLRRHMQSLHDVELTDVSKYKKSKRVEPTSEDADDVSVCEEAT